MKRIYIAEDQRDLAELIKMILSNDARYTTRVFPDGLKAYRAVREDPPDMLILDILLPHLNGLAIARLLKFHQDYRHIPVLVMSSIIDADIEQRARAAGADGFLAKPFEVHRLQGRVEELLALSALEG